MALPSTPSTQGHRRVLAPPATPEALEDGDPPDARFAELSYTSGRRDRPPTSTSPRRPTPNSATASGSGTAIR